MRRSIPSIVATLLLFLAALGLGACTDDFGTPCDFPLAPEVQEACGTASNTNVNSTATCIDSINPDCASRLCIIFQGSDSFCSELCGADGNCPPDSTCQPATGIEGGVCVLNSLVQ